MDRKGGMGNITLILILFIVFVVWGLVGSEKTKDVSMDCDIGWKTSLCWKWENSTDTMKDGASKVTALVIDKAKEKAPGVKDKIVEVILD